MRLLSWLLLAFSPSCALALSASSGTVPFVPDGNRVYAQVEFILPEWNPQMSRFDYAGRKMTLAQPATLRMRGTTVPFRLNPKTGLIVIERQSADGPIQSRSGQRARTDRRGLRRLLFLPTENLLPIRTNNL
jgi:hypothetical protein